MDVDKSTDIAVITKSLLDKKGVFFPVDLLIQLNHLSLQDYLAWENNSERDYLERKIMLPTSRLAECMRLVCAVAKEFSGFTIEFDPIGSGKSPMRDKEARKYFGKIFFKELQSDFAALTFFTANTICGSMIESLLSKDAEESLCMWNKLQTFIPKWYPWRYELEALVNAKVRFSQTVGKLDESLLFIETHLRPLAIKVFGGAHQQYLTPIWKNMKASIEVEEGWKNKPDYLLYDAIASWHVGEQRLALGMLCELCWRFPEHAEQAMSQKRVPDKKIIEYWDAFEDEGMEANEFPSCLLIKGYEIDDFEFPENKSSTQTFEATRSLILSPRDVSKRKVLKEKSPKLFQIFMRKQADG